MPWPAITARWSAPPLLPSHLPPPHPQPSPLYVHTRTTPLPHTVLMHMQQTYNRSVWTHPSLSQASGRKRLSCHRTVQNVSEPSHTQTKTPGFILFFLFLSFVTEFWQVSFCCCCSLVGVCILHMSAFGVLWTFIVFEFGFYWSLWVLYDMWAGREKRERGEGGVRVVCLSQWVFKAAHREICVGALRGSNKCGLYSLENKNGL